MYADPTARLCLFKGERYSPYSIVKMLNVNRYCGADNAERRWLFWPNSSKSGKKEIQSDNVLTKGPTHTPCWYKGKEYTRGSLICMLKDPKICGADTAESKWFDVNNKYSVHSPTGPDTDYSEIKCN